MRRRENFVLWGHCSYVPMGTSLETVAQWVLTVRSGEGLCASTDLQGCSEFGVLAHARDILKQCFVSDCQYNFETGS